jgi:thiamine kinase-like enzyme
MPQDALKQSRYDHIIKIHWPLSLAFALWQTSCAMSDEQKIYALPVWNGSITIEALTGGLSNANYLVTDACGKHVVRFGKDYPFHHVVREREVMVARAAHAAGFAPAVEYAKAGVMVTQFLEAQTFSAMDVKVSPERLGKLIRRFHLEMPNFVSGPGYMFWPFHVIRDYIITLNGASSIHGRRLAQFLKHAEAFEAAQVPLPIIFGHHDLLPANFLDDGKKLWLIDFEYAGFGTAMFDLAGISSNGHMHPDEKDVLLHAYLGETPTSAFMLSFAAMECTSLLRETLWAMVSSLFLAAPGVDYDAYTRENVNRYNAALDAYQKQHGKIQA